MRANVLVWSRVVFAYVESCSARLLPTAHLFMCDGGDCTPHCRTLALPHEPADPRPPRRRFFRGPWTWVCFAVSQSCRAWLTQLCRDSGVVARRLHLLPVVPIIVVRRGSTPAVALERSALRACHRAHPIYLSYLYIPEPCPFLSFVSSCGVVSVLLSWLSPPPTMVPAVGGVGECRQYDRRFSYVGRCVCCRHRQGNRFRREV